MPQTSLFATEPQVLVDDARGRVAYEPGFVDAAIARAWFDEMRARALGRAAPPDVRPRGGRAAADRALRHR